MSKVLYHVFGDFDYEALVWTDKGWRAPNNLEGARAVLFDNVDEAVQCAAAVRHIMGGHEDNSRLPLDTSPNEELPGEAGEGWPDGGWVMYDQLDHAWPEL